MKKIFILDTNVLLHDPYAIRHFEDNDIVIPLKVLEEIDKFKRDVNERGRNARQVSRTLDDLRSAGSLARGVPLENGGTLRVDFPRGSMPDMQYLAADDVILHMALELKADSGETPCILISKDINLRLKADALGLEAEDYENGHIVLNEMHPGFREVQVGFEILERFKQDRRIEPPTDDFSPNEYVILAEETDEGHTMPGRYDQASGRIVTLIPPPDGMTPIKPRNIEQQFAMDALLNDRVKVVTLAGKAGTGKTLLAVAAGVFKTLEEKTYQKLLVSRPTLPMGKDLGFLPGTLQEKLDPWMQPIYDALDLIRLGRGGHGKKNERDPIHSNEQIEVEPLSYIRGRSIPNQFMIVDEAQNLTPLEVKTVITRVGHGTKIILTGDVYQIDNPYVDSMSNGLNAVVEKFRPYDVAAHVMLTDGVRSEVAELAANVL